MAITVLHLPALTQGQTLLFEDFNDGVADAFSPLDSCWSVESGQAVCNTTGFDHFSIAVAGDFSWTNYAVECDILVQGSLNQVVIFRYQDPDNFYDINVRGEPYNDVIFTKVVNGSTSWNHSWPFSNSIGEWHHIRIGAVIDRFDFEVDGHYIGAITDLNNPYLSGGMALVGYTGGVVHWQIACFDNVNVYMQGVVATENATWSEVKALFR